MFKEPFASTEANNNMQSRIVGKMKETAEKVTESKDDITFTANLLDLCILNKMHESHL